MLATVCSYCSLKVKEYPLSLHCYETEGRSSRSRGRQVNRPSVTFNRLISAVSYRELISYSSER